MGEQVGGFLFLGLLVNVGDHVVHMASFFSEAIELGFVFLSDECKVNGV